MLLAPILSGGCGHTSTRTGDADEDRLDPLVTEIVEAVTAFDGTAGVFALHVPTGRSVAVNADSVFPTASLIKVPIMAALFDQIDRGIVGYHDRWIFRDSLRYPGVDVLASFRDGQGIEVAKVVMLMITLSDNTAALWCQRKVGGGAAVNGWLARKGYTQTRVNSRTPGREAAYERFGWGQTTPREMAQLFLQIRNRTLVGPAASEEMYRVLTNQYWNDEALSRIPPDVQVAAKSGAVSASKSEVLLASPPGGDYVLSVITKDQVDTRWESDNEGYRLIRRISAMAWQAFGTDPEWEPADGMERYWE